MLILRDINKSLHPYVLRNPHIGLDEVAAIARMPTVTADLLVAVCDRTEWSQRPEIALALVRNPKTPVPSALKVLGFVQRFGMGIALARKACADNSNPLPQFEVQPSAVLCTLRGRQ